MIEPYTPFKKEVGQIYKVSNYEGKYGKNGDIVELTQVANKTSKYRVIKTGRHYFKNDVDHNFPEVKYIAKSIEEYNSSKIEGIEPIEEETDNSYDAIIPEHYNQGEIDLIESWYLRYPFNEFKTGMIMYADRYFNRNKNNRVEDMKKGLYVMQRLKEYEEKELIKNECKQ